MSDAVGELRLAVQEGAAATRAVADAVAPLQQALGRADARAQQLAYRGRLGAADAARRVAAAVRVADEITGCLTRLQRLLTPVLAEADRESDYG
jgi:hypothetical protein